MVSPLLSVRDLSIRFDTDEGKVTAVDGVSFDLEAGEVLGIVGESGSGKSVTAKSIMRLNAGNTDYADTSKIMVQTDEHKVDVLSLKTQKQMRQMRGDLVSMIFQEPMASFAPAIPIGKQMVEQLRLHRNISKREAKEVAIATLKKVGISDAPLRFDQYAFELSGGMRQRAMIAMALSTKPKLLIADEPTTALDVTIQAQVIDLMTDLITETGMGVIFITHDLAVIAQTADKVAVMYLGRIVEYGTVDAVILTPRHPYTRGLLAARPDIDDLDAELTPVPGDIPSPLDRPGGCVFHTRCTHARSGLCDTQIPKPHYMDGEHWTACHLVDEEALP